MSLEIAIQELTQAVLMNVRSTDLLLAQFAEMNERPEVLHKETTQTTETPANVVGSKPKNKPVEKKLTDDEVKATKEYKDLIKAMGAYNQVAAQRQGDTDKARDMTLAIITRYTEDGKALTIVRGVLESEIEVPVLIELMAHYATEQAKLEASAEETNFQETQAAAAVVAEENGDDFGDEESANQYTDEDVKKALRAYAGVEGKPAAIAMLKKTTGSASVAGVDPSDYAKAIQALKTVG